MAKPIRLVPVDPHAQVGDAKWETHPTGGIRPIDPNDRGEMEIPCPACGAAFIREGSADLIRRCLFRCSACKATWQPEPS